MKNSVTSIFFMMFLSSCASNGTVTHWQGDSLVNLIAEYGTPDSFIKLNDGNKIVEYDQYSSDTLAGSFCSLTFMVDRQNRISGAKRQGNGINCTGS